jgi:hypothetical protein
MASEVPSVQTAPVTVVVQQPVAVPPMPKPLVITQPPAITHPLYLLTAVSDDEAASAQDTIRRLLDNCWYVFGDRTPGRKDLKPGDHICFYEAGVGVVAEAEVNQWSLMHPCALNLTSFMVVIQSVRGRGLSRPPKR